MSHLVNLGLMVAKHATGHVHLPMTDREVKDWGDANDKVLKATKTKAGKRMVKALERIAPWAAYAWVSGVIFAPRAMLSYQLMQEKKRAASAPPMEDA